jgi:hypothetical protein
VNPIADRRDAREPVHQPGCRAARHSDRVPASWVVFILILLFAAGAWFGHWLIVSAHDSKAFSGGHRAELHLWADLIGALVGYALGLFIVTCAWLWGTIGLFDSRPPWPAVVRWTVIVCAIFALLYEATRGFSGAAIAVDTSGLHRTQNNIVTAIGMVAAIPGLVGFLATRTFSVEKEQWTECPRCQVLLVLRLRRQLQRFLGALGLFLTLIVITVGARRRAVTSLGPTYQFPPEFVILYGLVFAGLLALFHGVATYGLNQRAEQMLDCYAPVPSPDAADINGPLQRRQDLQTLLGATGAWGTSFQAAVIVVAPLLTAIIGSALSSN